MASPASNPDVGGEMKNGFTDKQICRQKAAIMNNPIQTVLVDGQTIEIQQGSGNVFEDLGFPVAAEMKLKALLAAQVVKFIREGGLSQQEVAAQVGLKQPDISDILRGRLRGISVERLLAVINGLGHNIEVKVEPEVSENAHTVVLV